MMCGMIVMPAVLHIESRPLVHPAQFSGALVCASSIMHIKYSSRSKLA